MRWVSKPADRLTGAELLELIPEDQRDLVHPDFEHDGVERTPRDAAADFDEREAERPKQPTCDMCLRTLKVLAGVIPGAA